MRIRLAVLLVLGLVLYACVARSDTVTLRASADTTLFQFAPDNNLGGYVSLAAGTTAHGDRSRALLRFNVTNSLPPGARVTAARLRLRVVRAPLSGGRPSTFALHRMLKAWTEGDKATFSTGSPASDGETTWSNRFHPSVSWSAPGASAGLDFASLVSSSTSISSTGSYTFASSLAAAADVQAWLDRPQENHGWIVVSQSEEISETGRRIGSREDLPNAPVLEIDYVPFSVSRVERADETIKLFFPVRPGFHYTVEARPSVLSGIWMTLTNFTETSLPHEGLASDSTQTGPSRFYRVFERPL